VIVVGAVAAFADAAPALASTPTGLCERTNALVLMRSRNADG
jgi:hypothetical protein